jgi:hypothetical protein
LLVVLLVLLAPPSARAQELNLATLDQGQNLVQVRTGAEYGFVASAGYARRLPLLGGQVVVHGDVTLPWAGLDLGDFRVRGGALVPVVGTGHWKLSGGLTPTLRGTKNESARMTGVGADLSVLGGFYSPRWLAAVELGFDWALSTYIAHTAAYRSTVYAGARDGWYTTPGGNVRAGLQGGVSFGRSDLILRVGLVRDITGAAPLLPFYGTLAFNTRW